MSPGIEGSTLAEGGAIGRPVAVGVLPPVEIEDVLRRHEQRELLLARAAYSVLRLTAAVPTGSAGRIVAEASGAAQEAMAWLTGSATNPGRWTTSSVLHAELAEIEVLLGRLYHHLITVLGLIGSTEPVAPGRSMRVPRALAIECASLASELVADPPAALEVAEPAA